MPPTHISNLFALAKELRFAFAQCHAIENVLKNNAHLLKYYYSHGRDWKKLINENPNHYQKTWLSMANVPLGMKPNEQLPFGIAVLTWLPGQMTDIHGHPENGCIMMPLRGCLTEERFIDFKSLSAKNIILPGETSYIDNKIGMHQIKNNNTDTAVSLHIYSPGPC